MTQAITPAQAKSAKLAGIPDFVFEAFNELIVKHLSETRASFTQKEAVLLAVAKAKAANHTGITADVLFRNHWMDVEDHYRKAGWSVDYDKPAYNESYEATFTFVKKR